MKIKRKTVKAVVFYSKDNPFNRVIAIPDYEMVVEDTSRRGLLVEIAPETLASAKASLEHAINEDESND